jgi:hypothetical protein
MHRTRSHSFARETVTARDGRRARSSPRARARSMSETDVVRLERAVCAWNMDGSADAVPRMESFIRDAERATGRRRGRCSYDGCERDAVVGGHVHARGFGAVIAPICRECNSPRNLSRRQGGGSRLRAGIAVTRAEVTEGMLTGERRYAHRSWGGGHRGGDVCRDCGVTRVERGRDACERCRRRRALRPDATAAATRRSCACGVDISDRPVKHTVCLRCYRRGSFGSTSSTRRSCGECGVDISDRPASHTVCLRCYRRGSFGSTSSTRRSCRECGVDISDRPASHTVCLRCYRRGSFGSTSSPGRMLHTGYAVPGYAVPLRQETDTESESDSEWEII